MRENLTNTTTYKSMLPKGSVNEIAARVGVSRTAVSMFLHGRTRSRRIELAILDYIAQLEKERNQKLRKAGLL